jgi:glycosyltransferase involved in cell wall biosynthesis
MKKFTILHTIETGGPGGAESVLLALASRIDKNRFRSVALLPYQGWLSQKLEGEGVPVTVAKSSAWYDPKILKEMIRLVRREKVDLIHSHLADQNFYSCLAGRATGTKTAVTYHGLPGAAESGDFRGTTKSFVVRHWADEVVVVSDYLRRSLEALKFPADRITRIHNGVSIERFDLPKQGKIREELGYRNGISLIGMIANMRESKGYEYFVQAARHVANLHPHVRFVAVGEIDKTIGEKMGTLVQQMALQDHFLFLGFREDIPAILKDLDVFVLSSVSEGFSLATVEAMAAGKPVIATRSGGPQEIIDDGYTGILVPPADSNALAARILELLENPQRAQELARAGRSKAARMFSVEKMVSDYEALYDGLLDGN